MAKLWQFLQGHPKPAFSEKVQREEEEKFLKNHPKSSPCLKGKKGLWGKLNYTLIKMHLKFQDLRRFWHKQWLQKCPNGQVMVIIARSPKHAFSEKVKRGDQDKFFKNRLKSSPRLKGPTALWRKLHHTLIKMPVKVKNLEKILAQKADPKLPEWPSYGKFCKLTQNPHFLKKCKGGTKRNFSKIAQKVPLA